MATSSVTGPGSNAALNALTNTGGTQPLDKQAFLKLLVEQLKNQDPLKPQDDSAFIAQLAQFSQLEASTTTNDKLDTLAAQNSGMANSQAANLVGQEATVMGNLVTVDGTGLGAQAPFTLSGNAADVTIRVADQSGTVIRTIHMGPHAAGVVSAQWDGKGDSGNLEPAGTYAISVTATDKNGSPVSVSQQTSGQVTQVSFDKGYPVLTLDNGAAVRISDLLKIAIPPTNPTTTK
jgi:flagellar basal-body rod modification protein FlgD